MSATDPQSDALIDPALLNVLLHATTPTTIESLALQCDVSHDAIMRKLDELRAAGCTFDAHPQHGVMLRQTGLSAWSDYLHHVLGAGRPITVYRQTASTQDVARRLVAEHGRASDGALVVADAQTAGRGRMGRRWIAPAGSALAFTQVRWIDAARTTETADLLTCAAAVAVADAIERLLAGRARVQLKWPNDICIDGRKLAGILVETHQPAAGQRSALIGIGLNVDSPSSELSRDEAALVQHATILAAHGVATDRLRVLEEVVAAIDATFARGETATLLQSWRQRCVQLDQDIRLRCDGRLIEGRAVDLHPREGLIVRTTGGEIVHLPAATTTVV